MGSFLRILLVSVVAAAAALVPASAPAQAGSRCAPDGKQKSGAIFRICMPTKNWNGNLVIFAHGYVAFNEPVAIPENQLSPTDGPSLPEIVNGLGYAFATTSYSVNGLAIREGLADVRDLVDVFTKRHGPPGRVYLTGASEGGIITALAMEQFPDAFDGGVSTCGPVGDFPAQMNYWGDARVLFDYYYPNLLPGSPVSIPPQVINNWDSVYEQRIEKALRADRRKFNEYTDVARIPTDPDDFDASVDAVLTLMWYNVFATNDGRQKLNGQPFDNSTKIYRGSSNDLRLNQQVQRFSAQPTALNTIERFYQTSGDLTNPIVMMHTIDPIIPFWHQPIYGLKVALKGDKNLQTNLPILGRYGHCNFSLPLLLISFVLLVRSVEGTGPSNPIEVLTTEQDRQEYRLLEEEFLNREMSDPSYLFLPSVQSR